MLGDAPALTRHARIVDAPPPVAAIAVDGAFGPLAPGSLNLSHWPGNTTPAALRHDLSTGSALAFARLGPAAQRELAGDATLVCNNHYDTDGTCAFFSVVCPERALPRAAELLSAARAGDFFQVPDEDAFCVDAIVTALADPERSPLELAGLEPLERWQRATDHWIERFDALLDGDRASYAGLWEEPLERMRADRAALEACERDVHAELDLVVHRARQVRAGDAFGPGRHALFAEGAFDRVLVVGPAIDGAATYRLVISTLSWFELVSPAPSPRPDPERIAARLNERGGFDPSGEVAWRAQPITNAAPELWFGTGELESFAEHNAALRPCEMPMSIVLEEIGSDRTEPRQKTSDSSRGSWEL